MTAKIAQVHKCEWTFSLLWIREKEIVIRLLSLRFRQHENAIHSFNFVLLRMRLWTHSFIFALAVKLATHCRHIVNIRHLHSGFHSLEYSTSWRTYILVRTKINKIKLMCGVFYWGHPLAITRYKLICVKKKRPPEDQCANKKKCVHEKGTYNKEILLTQR